MSFSGPPTRTETLEEADQLLRDQEAETAIEAEVLSAPPNLVYNKNMLRLSRKMVIAVKEKWNDHVAVIDKIVPVNWKNEPVGRILEFSILHLAMSEISVLGSGHPIAINEAVHLAKRFCDGAAPRVHRQLLHYEGMRKKSFLNEPHIQSGRYIAMAPKTIIVAFLALLAACSLAGSHETHSKSHHSHSKSHHGHSKSHSSVPKFVGNSTHKMDIKCGDSLFYYIFTGPKKSIKSECCTQLLHMGRAWHDNQTNSIITNEHYTKYVPEVRQRSAYVWEMCNNVGRINETEFGCSCRARHEVRK
ncbi:hypothetical protein AKJ16_DCAP24258 [Drosera capensis]